MVPTGPEGLIHEPLDQGPCLHSSGIMFHALGEHVALIDQSPDVLLRGTNMGQT
jgi:hypothetical protein